MSSSLADYLAKNYLTADPASQPKKKRKKAKNSGLIIADDDPPSLRSSAADDRNNHPNDEDSPYVVDTARPTADFRRKKVSNWKTLGAESAAAAEAADQAAADAIIAAAATEDAARRNADGSEDALVVTDGYNSDDDDDDDDDGGALPLMESGARAGLQTAEQTAAMVAAEERRRKADVKASLSSTAGSKDPAAAAVQQETIYRDASGRIINVTMKRAEARRAAEEQRLKEEQARVSLMGDVQRQEREVRRQELREAEYLPLARTADDEVMNKELKSRQRWNDPAAQFLSTTTTTTTTTTTNATSGRPIYKGSYQPNRYGIRPGHRWDGVDRSTSFEKEWFAARQKKANIGALEYKWQMDE
ncbi:Pre-mRNA-splicing factor of RES complex domain containing protein [Elaphomyces granulatus]